MKIKIYVVDFEAPRWLKVWGIRLGGLALVLGTAAVAIAAGPLHVWASGDTLQATDLNGNFAAIDARLTALEGSERIERATLGSDGTIVSQTGSWISLINHSGTGGYAITFAAGTFSAAPTCVTSASAGNQIAPSVECYGVSKDAATCAATSASRLTSSVGDSVDTGISLICIGPR